MRPTIKLAAVGALTIGLAGCAQSRMHLSDDYGRAVRQDAIAQIDDPDAKYVGIPEAGSHGRRQGLAMDRYVRGQVIEPASAATSKVKSTGGEGGGGGGGGSPSQ